MKKLFESYANIIEEEFLDEARVDFSNLSDNIIAIVDEETMSLSLIDITNYKHEQGDTVNLYLGYIEFNDSEQNEYDKQVFRVAAAKGYGLLTYELGMQMIYPDDLVSSRNGETRKGAFRLYQYYYNGMNPRVLVTKIEPSNPEWVDCVDNPKATSFLKCSNNPENPSENVDSQMIKMYNSKLSMSPNEITPLAKRGEEFMQKYGLQKSFLTRLGRIFFNRRYTNSM